jgi:hypothetical protein
VWKSWTAEATFAALVGIRTMSDMLALLEKRLKASQQAHQQGSRAAESTSVKKRKAPTEDVLADASTDDVVKGVTVFGQRGDGYAEAIVRGPSKKVGHWALKFGSDGKVLPRRLEQIKVRNNSADTKKKERNTKRATTNTVGGSGDMLAAAQMCEICKNSFVCGDKLVRCGNGSDKGCFKGFHRECVGLKSVVAKIPQLPEDPKQAIITVKRMNPDNKKQILKSIGLSIHGNRKDLEERLLAAVAAGANRAPENWYCAKCKSGKEGAGDEEEGAGKEGAGKGVAPPTDIQTLKHMKTIVWNILNKEDPKYRKVWVTNDDRCTYMHLHALTCTYLHLHTRTHAHSRMHSHALTRTYIRQVLQDNRHVKRSRWLFEGLGVCRGGQHCGNEKSLRSTRVLAAAKRAGRTPPHIEQGLGRDRGSH